MPIGVVRIDLRIFDVRNIDAFTCFSDAIDGDIDVRVG